VSFARARLYLGRCPMKCSACSSHGAESGCFGVFSMSVEFFYKCVVLCHLSDVVTLAFILLRFAVCSSILLVGGGFESTRRRRDRFELTRRRLRMSSLLLFAAPNVSVRALFSFGNDVAIMCHHLFPYM
jgi:hypothetical protein